MNTDIHPIRRLHRHAVVAPILGCALVLSLGAGTRFVAKVAEPLSKQTSWAGSGGVLHLPGGVAAVPDASATLDLTGDIPVLGNGTALFYAHGFFRVRAGAWVVSGLEGAFFVSYQGDVLTVAGITSPAVARTPSGARVLVPIGRQWRATDALPTLAGTDDLAAWFAGRALEPIADEFFRYQLESANLLDLATDAFLPAAIAVRPLPPRSHPFLALLAAEQRAQESYERALFGYVRSLSEAGDAAGIVSLLHDDDARTVLQHSPLRWSVLPVLASRAGSGIPVARSLLSLLSDSPDFSLVSAIHPLLRESAWNASLPDGSANEIVLLRLFALPASDNAPKAVASTVVSRWQFEVQSLLGAEADPAALRERLATDVLPILNEQEAQGYPERAQRYATAILGMERAASGSLTSQEETLLPQYEFLAQRSVDPLFTASLVSPSLPLDSVPDPTPATLTASGTIVVPFARTGWDAESVQQRAYALLRDAGALFTVETRLKPLDPDTVDVRGIVVESPSGQQSYDFVLTLDDRQVSSISVRGTNFPYAQDLASFMAWARSGVAVGE